MTNPSGTSFWAMGARDARELNQHRRGHSHYPGCANGFLFAKQQKAYEEQDKRCCPQCGQPLPEKK